MSQQMLVMNCLHRKCAVNEYSLWYMDNSAPVIFHFWAAPGSFSADGDAMLWGTTQNRPGFAAASCVDMPSSCAGNTNSIILKAHNMTKHYIQHGPLGCERISNAPKPISSELKLGSTHSKLKSVEGDEGRPPFYFEMRPSHPRGL